MTEEQSKQFFKWHEDKPLAVFNGYGCAIVEDMYQAFETRIVAKIKSESTLNIFPEEK